MRLMKSVSPNAVSLYVIKSINVNGRRSTKIVEKLGTYAQLKEKLGGEDPEEWACLLYTSGPFRRRPLPAAP